MTEITAAERVSELYASLANPELPDDLARVYMKEYLDLTGTSSENVDSIVFWAQREVNPIDIWVERAVNVTLILGVAVWAGFVIWAVRDIYKDRRGTLEDTYIEHLLDKERIVSLSTEDFLATIAEAEEMLAKRDEVFESHA